MSDDRRRVRQTHPWLRLQPPLWVPYAWWALLLGSIVAGMFGEQAVGCSVAAPCQPDAVFPMAVALLGVAAVAFWWEPLAALVAGVGFGVLGAAFDPSVPGRYAAVVVACASLGGVAFLRSLRAKQAVIARGAAAADPSPLSLPIARGGPRLRGWAAVAVPAVGFAGLLLVAGSLLGHRVQTRAEQVHLDRAVATHAHVVTQPDDDYRQAFELEDGLRAGQRVVIEVTETLDPGSRWVVLLDPQDAQWSRLASEPKGHTFWFGWAALGGFVSGWALLRLLAQHKIGRQDDAPALHRVRVMSGRAEIILADSAEPVAWVLLGSGDRRHHAVVPARIRGPVADGAWVDIETRSGPLPVVGPVRATHRWRNLDLDSPAHPRLSTVADRALGMGPALVRLLSATLDCLVLWFSLADVVPTWHAAHGRGVAGDFTVISKDCGGKGPCVHHGDFRSADGRYSFSGVELAGDSAPVGETVPALYEGRGEAPDRVFAPGWTALAENTFYMALGSAFLLEPLARLLEPWLLRRRPSSGRHTRGRG